MCNSTWIFCLADGWADRLHNDQMFEFRSHAFASNCLGSVGCSKVHFTNALKLPTGFGVFECGPRVISINVALVILRLQFRPKEIQSSEYYCNYPKLRRISSKSSKCYRIYLRAIYKWSGTWSSTVGVRSPWCCPIRVSDVRWKHPHPRDPHELLEQFVKVWAVWRIVSQLNGFLKSLNRRISRNGTNHPMGMLCQTAFNRHN